MAEKLLVYLNTRSEDVQWAVTAHSDGSVIDEGVGALSGLAKFAKGRHVVAILPSDEVFLSQINLPTKNINKARLAAPSQLEDQLSEDIDGLHFALAKGEVAEDYSVAVIAKQRLGLYEVLFKRANLKVDAMLPSVLALPQSDHRWGALSELGGYVVRTGMYAGFVCEPDLLSIYLEKVNHAQDDESTPALTTYLDSDTLPDAQLDENDWDIQQKSYRNPMWVFAEGLKNGVPLNLLQGDFKPTRAHSTLLKNWLPTLVLLGVVLLLWFAYMAYDGFRLKKENQRIQADIERLYKKSFPGSRMLDSSRLKREIDNKLNTMRGGSSGADFLQKSHDLFTIIKSMEMRVHKLSYRQNQFDVDVATKKLSDLDQLKSALVKKGFSAELTSTASDPEGSILGKFRIK